MRFQRKLQGRGDTERNSEIIELLTDKGTTEDKMVGWRHRLNGHEFEQTPWDDEGQGSLEWYSPWGQKQLDTTKPLNNNNKKFVCLTHSEAEQTELLGSEAMKGLLHGSS